MSNHPVVLITGAAKRIGAATVKLLHKHNCNIIIHCRNSTDDAQKLCDELNTQRDNSAIFFNCPLDDIKQLQSKALKACEQWGRLDYLLNNASSFYPKEVAETTEDDWNTLIDSNVKGAFFLSQCLEPLLKESQGAVVNIVDIYAETPLEGHTAYCIAKSGLAMLTKSLAKEFAPDVRVNGVSPGAILWPETGGVETMSDSAKQQLLEKVPLRRAGEANDIANTVKFLLMNAPYITGQIIAVDGGRSLHI